MKLFNQKQAFAKYSKVIHQIKIHWAFKKF